MKKLATIILVTLLAVTAQAQINFETGSFKEALIKASAEGKMIFMDCYTDWCMPCKILDHFVFKSVEGGDYFNKNFVNVKMDMEKGEGIELQKKYVAGVFPTLLLLNPDGTEHNRLTGATNKPAEFIARVEEAVKKENGMIYRKELYEKDKSKANEYFSFLLSRGEYKKVEPLMLEAFKQRAPQANYSKESFDLYDKAIHDIYNPLFFEILLDGKNASNTFGEEKFREFVDSKSQSTFTSLVGAIMSGSIDYNSNQIKKLSALIEQFPVLNTNTFKFIFAAEKPLIAKNGTEISAVALEYIEKGNLADENAISMVMPLFGYITKDNKPLIAFFEKLAAISKSEANRTKHLEKVEVYKKMVAKVEADAATAAASKPETVK